MIQDPIPYKDQLKEALQVLLLKVVSVISSRKFWALVFGVFALYKEYLDKAIPPEAFVAGLVGLLVAYGAGVVIEDVQRIKALMG